MTQKKLRNNKIEGALLSRLERLSQAFFGFFLWAHFSCYADGLHCKHHALCKTRLIIHSRWMYDSKNSEGMMRKDRCVVSHVFSCVSTNEGQFAFSSEREKNGLHNLFFQIGFCWKIQIKIELCSWSWSFLTTALFKRKKEGERKRKSEPPIHDQVRSDYRHRRMNLILHLCDRLDH